MKNSGKPKTISLTAFKRRSGEYIRQMKRSKKPIVLTLDGKLKLVIQDAKSFQSLLDAYEKARLSEAIQYGIKELQQGKRLTPEQIFEECYVKRER